MKHPMRIYVVAVDQLRLGKVVADLADHPDLRIAGSSCVSNEVPRRCVTTRAQVAVVAVGPVPIQVLSLVNALRSSRPRIETVALAEKPYLPETIQALLSAGARGIISENASTEEVQRAARAVAGGGCVFGPEAAEIILEHAAHAQHEHIGVPLESLDLEILALLASGSSRSQVAARMGVDSGTVLSSLRSAKVALRQRTQEGVIAAAIRRGLI